MRAIVATVSVAIAAGAAWAQQTTPTKTYSSAADVAALVEKAMSDRKDAQPLVLEQILQLAPYNVNLEYRTAVAPAAVHEKEAELFFVLQGSATMVTGGKLTNEKRTNATNLTGTAIEGGRTQPVAKGDFIMVPENTPHWFSALKGTLILMSLHVPRTGTSVTP